MTSVRTTAHLSLDASRRHSRALAQVINRTPDRKLALITQLQRRLILALCALYIVVAVCTAVLFLTGKDAFGAAALVGLAFGLVGLAKVRRAFRSPSTG
jgi:hypothetical protein